MKIDVSKLFGIALFPLAGFVACGDDSSGSSKPPLSESMPECTADLDSETRMDEKSGIEYVCKNGEWIEKDSTSQANRSSSSARKDGTSSSENVASSSSVSSSSVSKRENIFACNDHINKNEIYAQDGILHYKVFYKTGMFLGEGVEEQKQQFKKGVCESPIASREGIASVYCKDSTAMFDPVCTIIEDSLATLDFECDEENFQMGIHLQMVDSKGNRAVLQIFRDTPNGLLSMSCDGGMISQCFSESESSTTELYYSYSQDALRLSIDADINSADSSKWLYYKLVQSVGTLADEDFDNLPTLLGIHDADNPYLAFFKKKPSISGRFYETGVVFDIRLAGYENRELADAVMNVSCGTPGFSLTNIPFETERELQAVCVKGKEGEIKKNWYCKANNWWSLSAPVEGTPCPTTPEWTDKAVDLFVCSAGKWKVNENVLDDSPTGTQCSSANAGEIAFLARTTVGLEKCVEFDDDLMMKYLDGEEITSEEFQKACGKDVIQLLCSGSQWEECSYRSPNGSISIGGKTYSCQSSYGAYSWNSTI